MNARIKLAGFGNSNKFKNHCSNLMADLAQTVSQVRVTVVAEKSCSLLEVSTTYNESQRKRKLQLSKYFQLTSITDKNLCYSFSFLGQNRFLTTKNIDLKSGLLVWRRFFVTVGFITNPT